MPNFGELFIRSKGEPLAYAGQTLVMLDKFPARLGERLLVTIESTRASWPQGVGMSNGVEFFGTRAERGVVWEYFSVPPDERPSTPSRLPFSFEVTCRNRAGSISFYNMTEFEGRQECWTGGSCMIVTEMADGRRYACNDFDPDDDFDDLVFTVRRVNASQPG